MRERLKNYILVGFVAIAAFGVGYFIGVNMAIGWIVNFVAGVLKMDKIDELVWQLMRLRGSNMSALLQ